MERSELDVFQNALRVISGTLLIQTEVEFVELYKGQPLFADVDIFLRGTGFQFHAFNGFGGCRFNPPINNNAISRSFSQALWSDALYVRDWMKLDTLEVSKLEKYAVLAHDLLRSFDLAHIVLLKLDQKTGGTLAPRYLARLTTGDDQPQFS